MKNSIDPTTLFDKRILDYRVQTDKLGMVSYVNLDNAATTPPFKVVEKGVRAYLTSYGSVHRGAGIKSTISTDLYEDTREAIKDFVHAPQDAYVLFTGNTTGAMNTAAYFFSFLKGKVAVSEIEHSSSWLPWVKTEGIVGLKGRVGEISEMNEVNRMIQQLGQDQVIRYQINDAFEFDLKHTEHVLKENQIKAFVLTASSNVTGYCPDIKKIGALVHKYHAWFIVDACQYLQHHQIDMQAMGIDFLAASGHKFYAPYGGGFLIGPKSFLDAFLPYQIGGGNLPYITAEGEFLRYQNQLAHDPGTPNALGAISMAIALKEIELIGIDAIAQYERMLTKRAYEALRKIQHVELYVSDQQVNTIIPFTIRGKKSVEVAERLNRDYGIGVRAGSFCAYQIIRKLLKVVDETPIVCSVRQGENGLIPGIIRASFSLCNRPEDVDRFIHAVSEIARNK